jgi:hypothetical protein
MELKENQSALVLEIDENDEITVNVASGDHDGLTASICGVLAKKMLTDKKYYEVKDSKKFTAQKPLKVTIGKNKTLTLSSKILENSDFNSGDVFNLKVAKKKIILTLIEE